MTRQEEKYFKALAKDREENADVLEKPSMSGTKNSVTDKYSDQAHFIYELLQNADDAKATSARFELYPDRLVFAHNGTERFSVSDPKNEEEDKNNGRLGHINAITSIGNSTKGNSASIGKFGVGFKAVFQYTATPHIYDPKFRFRIERFIVPVRLTSDYSGRSADETLFVFPFNHPEVPKEKAYEEVEEKLCSLSDPILFLSNLERITFHIGSKSGMYSKRPEKEIDFSDSETEKRTTAKLMRLKNSLDEDVKEKRLWMFSRDDDDGRKYSVGFFLDEQGSLRPVVEPAFCFFPTKEVTGLKFIIHAPFLLTDSREGIKAGNEHNKNMIILLSNLAEDSLEYLRDIGPKNTPRLLDDRIIDIIPTDEDAFSNAGRNRISFKPFFTAIKNAFKERKIIPTRTAYTNAEHAYLAGSRRLMDVFSNKHLKWLVNDPDAHWVFTSSTFGGRDTTSKYLRDIVKCRVEDSDVLTGRKTFPSWSMPFYDISSNYIVRKIDDEFIKQQPVEWLHKFYKWVSESENRKNIILRMPVILASSGEAVSARDEKGNPVLFLPSAGMQLSNTVHPSLLENEDTVLFLKSIGVREPSKRDYIYNEILPQYKNGRASNPDSHFWLFLDYYQNDCPQGRIDSFINLIKGYSFVRYTCKIRDEVGWGCAANLYWPDKDLIDFFAYKPDIHFLDLDKYSEILEKQNTGEFSSNTEKTREFSSRYRSMVSFLNELGVRREATISIKEISSEEGFQLAETPWKKHWYNNWREPLIIGLSEFIYAFRKNPTEAQSVVLWNILLRLVETFPRGKSLSSAMKGTFQHWPQGKGNHKHEQATFDSRQLTLLRTESWLMDKSGKFVPPSNMLLDNLSPVYDKKHGCVDDLIDFLKIQRHAPPKIDRTQFLTNEEKDDLALGKEAREAGLSPDEFHELIQKHKQLKERKKQEDGHSNNLNPFINRNNSRNADNTSHNVDNADYDTDDVPDEGNKATPAVRRAARDIVRRTGRISSYRPEPISKPSNGDEDDYSRRPVDYARKIEQQKEKSARELERIAYLEELQDRAMKAKKYTYSWFKILLEMETLNGEESSYNSREVSIHFGCVDLEEGTTRTLVLRQPSRGIPRFMEELPNLSLKLNIDSGNKTLGIEVASVLGYTLRVKLKNSADIEDIDFSSIKDASIDARNPTFLLEELRKQFEKLEYADSDNLQEKLCANIRFIFGPPGTGKTTYLARNELIPLMAGTDSVKVLVLTPTNKAADILTARVIDEMCDDTSWSDWLIRFGATADERIEQSGVYREKTFDIQSISRCVTITTMDRFPYDYFLRNDGQRLQLDGLMWDYIVFDEASMIPLFKIIYPLFKKTPREFIISGDPFQIEPVASINLWQDENIYTMTCLDSFTEPMTVPNKYPVETLTTQYRSVPEIGELFSQLFYGGVLKHDRTPESQRDLGLDNVLRLGTLTIIRFPVSRYESIYRAKRLGSSPYHIYSALFTYELSVYLANQLSAENPGEQYQIGIISPYKAQSDLLDKLLLSTRFPDSVRIQAGTIHAFQGDECDIILALFNPPPQITANENLFLNKRNIINVAVSRAKDYLVLLVPDEQTEGIESLELINDLAEMAGNSSDCMEYYSQELEYLMYGNRRYLEENTFVTSHQNVNIYEKPERRYEVRSEDTAIDIQRHDKQ